MHENMCDPYIYIYCGKHVDPDQMASEKPADLDLHCFQHRIYLGQPGKGLLKIVKKLKCPKMHKNVICDTQRNIHVTMVTNPMMLVTTAKFCPLTLDKTFYPKMAYIFLYYI